MTHGVLACPHTPEDSCLCHKPRPGLLLRAPIQLGPDLSASAHVGAAWADVVAGRSGGRRTVMARTRRHEAFIGELPRREAWADRIATGPGEAVEMILGQTAAPRT